MTAFEGKVVIVTGAGSGIGAASARRFGRDGAMLTLAGRRAEKLAAVAAGMDPARTLVHPADVADEQAVAALVAATVARFGRLDVLVCNAGTAALGPLQTTSLDEWRRIMATNVDGLVLRPLDCFVARAPRK